MPVLASGNSTSLTLGTYDSITLQNRAGQSASLTVGGVLINGAHSGTRTYGPYPSGGAVSITATAGDVYYETADGSGQTLPVNYREDGSLSGGAAGAVSGIMPFGLGAVASAGDSIADFGQQASPTITRKTARGVLNWALALSGQPFEYLGTDDYALEATSSAHLLNVQVPAIEAAHRAGRRYARVYVSCGTNDNALFSLTASETVSNLRVAFARIRALGAQVDWLGILPRGSGAKLVPADASFTAIKRHAAEVNARMSMAHLQGEFNMVDCLEQFADNSTAFGNMLSSTNFDGLHLSNVGACLGGKALAASWARAGIGSAMRFISVAGDLFNRTTNPYGAINSNPLLAGGPPATGYTTVGGTWSKVSRTLANGQTRSDPSCALAVATNHLMQIDVTATGAWAGATQVAPGDVVEGRCLVKLTGVSGLRSVTLQVRETNGSSVSDEVSHFDLSTESADTSALPLIGDEYLWLRVPRATIRAYDGAGNAALRLRIDLDTATGVGAGDVAIQGFEMRPVSLAS